MPSALRRSFDVYYRDAARTARMDRLNAAFVGEGDLAFDIGAHVGDRTASFRRLGASVVTLEPQPRLFRALQLIHGRDEGVVLRREAVGRAPGEVTLHLNTDNPTVSTASTALIAAAPQAAAWADQTWDQMITVPVTTLDHLIAQHGTPSFTKIDVEGFEAEVLLGLTTPLPALSFEFTTLQRDVAFACLTRLQTLGPYEFNLSLGESHSLDWPHWTTATALHTQLSALSDAVNSGDVYARLKDWRPRQDSNLQSAP